MASAASGERRLSPPRTTAPSRLRGADPPSATRPPCARCRTAPAPTPCSTASATPWPSAPGPVPPPRLARAAARHADAEAGLRAEYDHCAAARTVGHDLPCAAAVVAVHVPGGLLSVAWSGDARACLLLDGHLRLLTEDHNARRVYDDGDRNLITSCLGEARSDEETERLWGHPAIEYLRCPTRPGRLLLASDGAYEPHEDAGRDLAAYLTGDPRTAAERLVDDAVRRARALPDPYADNATALIARITC
ncbi:hypothetical protein AB0L74_32735 [Streptomyces sp. NPDC052020]|uniref:hypothetical protein n=1 Tax=Streptomyces sp. NPDC052020 TaxID=3155677 RepID=UPI003412AFD1